MAYKHRVVQGLAQLLDKYGGGGDPIMRSVWWGLKGQIPMILHQLDNSEEAIKMIEDKLYEVLDVKRPEAKEPVTEPADKSLVVEPMGKGYEAQAQTPKPPKPTKRKRVRKQELVEAMEEPVVEAAEFETVIEPAEE